jgi:DNA repair protein RadC
MMAPQLMHFHA